MTPPNGGVAYPNMILVTGPYAPACGRTQSRNVADAACVGRAILRVAPVVVQVTHGMGSIGLYDDLRDGMSDVHATQRRAWASLAGRLDGVLVCLTYGPAVAEPAEVRQDVDAFRASGGRWELRGTAEQLVFCLESLARADQGHEVRLGALSRQIRDVFRGAGSLSTGGPHGIAG